MSSEENRELLFSVTIDDFDVTWFSGTGSGGQYRNKHQNCCRMIHRASGAMGTGQSQRSQVANKREAFINVTKTPKFVVWLEAKKLEYQISGPPIEELVDRAMRPKNLKIEVLDPEGDWVTE